MKKTIFISLISFCVITFYACDKCRLLDCSVTDTSALFRVVDKSNGKDLVFGNNPIYDKNKIKFFTLNGTDTTFFKCSPENKYGISTQDSILKVYFPENVQMQVLIQLNNVDTDTLRLSYNTENTKCCGSVTTISKFLYNTTNDLGGNDQVKILKK
jgi:hypothetical protein